MNVFILSSFLSCTLVENDTKTPLLPPEILKEDWGVAVSCLKTNTPQRCLGSINLLNSYIDLIILEGEEKSVGFTFRERDKVSPSDFPSNNICGACFPRPPFEKFTGEISNESEILNFYPPVSEIAINALLTSTVVELDTGHQSFAFIRDRNAVNGLSWDLVIIPIKNGRLDLNNVKIIYRGWLEQKDALWTIKWE